MWSALGPVAALSSKKGLQYCGSLSRIMGNSLDNLYPLATAVLILSMGASAMASGICNTADCSPAEGWDNFANNFGSDLAPLLALFGEQVTTQYLSESLDWMDSLLVAIAPLGIITTMVSAIRIAGSPLFRSLVGRAKESRGTVEADLMSSTSADVCELWSGESVVRVLGEPKLLHLVHIPSEEKRPISSFAVAVQDKRYKEPVRHPWSLREWIRGSRGASTSHKKSLGPHENPPNLLFNITFKPRSRQTMIALILLGILLQGGVLAFAAITQYKLGLPKNDRNIPGYAFPVFLVGTVGLTLGLFLCAQVIETSTIEFTWEPASPTTTTSIWLQQGGQKVGDQQFQSFSWSSGTSIKTSHKREGHNAPARSALVILGVTITLLSFITQFFGLRATHSSVIVLQLGAILVMTAVRSWAHLKLESKNNIDCPLKADGSELDWLAKDLTNCDSWEILSFVGECAHDPAQSPADVVEHQDEKAPSQTTRWSTGLRFLDSKYKEWFESKLGNPRRPPAVTTSTSARKVMIMRAQLAELSQDWTVETRGVAGVLADVIERSMNDIFAKMTMKLIKDEQFHWVIPVKAKFRTDGHEPTEVSSLPTEASPLRTEETDVTLTLTRKWDQQNGWGEWTCSRSEIEAALSLWVSSLSEAKSRRPDNGLQAIIGGEARYRNERLAGPATDVMMTNYRLWIYRETPTTIREFPPGNARSFGHPGTPEERYLCVGTHTSMVTLFAQEIFTCFLKGLIAEVLEIGGSTFTRRSNLTTIDANGLNSSGDQWAELKLQNENLQSIAGIFNDSGLGTVEEAYLCIFPALNSCGKIPYVEKACKEAGRAAKRFEAEGQWEKSFQIDRWLHSNLKATNISTHDINTIVVEIGARLRMLSYTLISQIRGKYSTIAEQDSKSSLNVLKMWDTVKLRCDLLGALPPSEDRALGLVTLCTTYQAVIADRVGEIPLQPVSQMLRCFSDVPGFATAINDARNTAGDKFHDPEVITRFLCTHFMQEREGAVSPLVRRVLLDVRQRSGAFLTGSKFEEFLLRTPLAHRNAIHGGSHPDDEQIPADILLIRGYRTPLPMAAESGNERVVRRLMNERVEINRPLEWESGRTALQAAAGAGHVAIVDMLLNEGARVNAKPARVNGRTALQAAAENKDDDDSLTVKLAKGNVNAPPGPISGRTALQAAAECGNIKIVARLLKLDANVDAVPATSFGRTALQAAAGHGHIEIVKMLLGDGDEEARINARPASKGGRTALQAAVEGGHLDVVTFLVSHGAKVNALPAPDSGRTALQAAAERGNIDIVRMLLDAGASANAQPAETSGRTALQAAVEGTHQDVVAVLLKADANVNAAPANANGQTVLQAAIASGYPGLFEMILASKADLEDALYTALEHKHTPVIDWLAEMKNLPWNVRDPEGMYTPLARAVVRKHKRVVKTLLSWKHVDSRLPGHNNLTLFHHAVEANDIALVELLTTGGKIDVNAVDLFGNTPLHKAVTEKKIEVIQQLLNIPGLNINAVNKEKNTPLHIAIAKTLHIIVGRFLDNENISVDSQNIDHRTPLSLAAARGDEKIIEILLRKSTAKEVINSKDIFGQTALLLAVKGRFCKVVQQLLNLSEIDTTIRDSDQLSPLHLAASNGHKDILALLLNRPDSCETLNEKSIAQHTPLWAAAERGHSKIVEMLLARNDVQIDAPDSKGRTPLDVAVKNKHYEIVKILMKSDVDGHMNRDARQQLFVRAVGFGQHDIIEILLDKDDVRINDPDSKGRTPLDIAVKNKHYEIVKTLVGRNDLIKEARQKLLLTASRLGDNTIIEILLDKDDVQINAPDSKGQTPLHIAVENKYYKIVKTLVGRNDVEINARNEIKRTPLHIAAENGHSEVVEMLLAKDDVEINAADLIKQTPLLIAAKNGRSRVVEKFLARNDVEINAANFYDQTPLHIAAENGHSEVVKMLLAEKDVETNTADSYNQTPLHVAARNGYSEVVKMLLEKDNLEINAADSDGYSPLHIAAKNGHSEVVKMILEKDNLETNTADSAGYSPLHIAAANGHYDVLVLLLSRRDVKVSLQDNDKYTPYLRAIGNGHSKIANALLQRIEKDVSDKMNRSQNQNSRPGTPSHDAAGATASPPPAHDVGPSSLGD